jgi:hypothetical protein
MSKILYDVSSEKIQNIKRSNMSAKKITLLIFSLFLFVSVLVALDNEVKVIQGEDDLPDGFRSIGKPGDYLITDGTIMALIGGSDRMIRTHSLNYPLTSARGLIIGFMPNKRDTKGTVGAGIPLFKSPEKYTYIAYDSVTHKTDPVDGSLCFTASGRWEGKEGSAAEITTHYQFIPGKSQVRITSSIKNSGHMPLKDVDCSLIFLPYHDYSFMPYDDQDIELPEVRVYPKETHAVAWVGRRPSRRDEILIPGSIAPGNVHTVEYSLHVHHSTDSLMSQVFRSLDIKAEQLSLHLEGIKDHVPEVIIREPVSRSIFFRGFLETDSLVIPIPEGVYSVQVNFFPAVIEEFISVKSGQENIIHLENPPGGEIHILVHDSNGLYVPAKVTFLGLDPTRSPYFKPDNPVKSGKEWEHFKNSCFPPKEGLDLHLPVGSYLVVASRGPEYSVDTEVIEVLADSIHLLDFTLDHVLDTPRLVSIDPHMHTRWSDGDTDIPERLMSVIAEGVDVAVATDHNILIDYAPVLEKLGLEEYLTVMVGNEITQNDLIHYNSYPLSISKEKEYNGAIYPAIEDAGALFASSRQGDSSSLIQVNHPRSSYQGYFHTHGLDLGSAAYVSKAFSMNFDVIEVMNGPRFAYSNMVTIQDWLHFLDRGYFFPAVGSSDSHSIDGDEPGYSRTYIIFDEKPKTPPSRKDIIDKLKQGRSFVSNGPLVELRLNDLYGPGDLVASPSSLVKVTCRVDCASWVHVDELRLIINGERKMVFPISPDGQPTMTFQKSIEIPVEKDAYIVAEIIGHKSLYPVLQSTATDGEPEQATRPYALTNPVFIDVDGNGRFDPPVADKIQFVENPPPLEKIERY